MSTRMYAFMAAVGTLLVSGAVCHLLAKDSAQLDDAAARIALVPKTIGDWQATDEEPDDRSFEQAGAKSYWMRTYVNQRTKDSVLVILMCGRPGKMAVHTPEICYRGAGFALHDEPTAIAVKGEAGDTPAQFWTAHFTKKATIPMHLRLYWAWNARGDWEASPVPRWQFRGEPFLYKLYISRDNSEHPNLSPQADPSADFLRRFVPEMKNTLFRNDAT